MLIEQMNCNADNKREPFLTPQVNEMQKRKAATWQSTRATAQAKDLPRHAAEAHQHLLRVWTALQQKKRTLNNLTSKGSCTIASESRAPFPPNPSAFPGFQFLVRRER